MKLRNAKAVISLHALRSNVTRIQNLCAESTFMAVVKANAYGHQLDLIVNELLAMSIHHFAVSSVWEGTELRNVLSKANAHACTVLCFIPPQEDEIEIALKQNLTLTISSVQEFESLLKKVREHDQETNFHLKVDTGMTRQGCCPDEAWQIALAYHALKYTSLTMRGIYTHFPCDSNISFTQNQLASFLNTANEIQKLLGHSLIKHAANSGGALFIPESRLDMVRIGIAMYGAFSPTNTMPLPFKQNPVMKLVSYISLIKFIAKGTAVSYNATWVAKEDTHIAIVIIGYADGFPRIASNRAFVSIHGKKYPQVGNVTMDQIMINIGMENNISVGDEVVIFGDDLISVTDFATWASTISYECLTSISERLSREEE